MSSLIPRTAYPPHPPATYCVVAGRQECDSSNPMSASQQHASISATSTRSIRSAGPRTCGHYVRLSAFICVGSSLSAAVKHGCVIEGVGMNCHLRITSITWNYRLESVSPAVAGFLPQLAALQRTGPGS
ncbi:unnamed protein product [Pleuronectes platessa]|uniref:Uncharacterized protein n=1 Tax=Pleuronectes platessa TaxID=8262 RepID=A0A9N7Y7T3_PLEPL|nr:unnamed protein product [Pleuronectes platessa]